MRKALGLLLIAATLLAARASYAQTAVCNALAPKQRQAAQKLLDSLHPYDCCDGTISACLAVRKARCKLAARLADDVCRQVKAGRGDTDIQAAIARRAQSMIGAPGGKPPTLAVDEAMRGGDASAPVQVVVYACTRCPFCRQLVPPLFKVVAEGPLKGKVKLYYRPFPLRDHEGSTEGGLALMAAARLGSFWPMLLTLYDRFDQFAPEKLSAWAGEKGMDRSQFDTLFADPAVRDALVASKREGLKNKVTATPTLFVDGKRYDYELDPGVIADVLSEEYDRVTRTDRE